MPHAAPDDYERRFMDADRALVRVRTSMPKGLAAFIGALTLFALALFAFCVIAYGEMATAGWFSPALCRAGQVLSVLVLLFAPAAYLSSLASRVTITREAVHVQRGMQLDSFPLEAIVEAKVLMRRLPVPPRTPLGKVLVLRVARGKRIGNVYLACAQPETVLSALREAKAYGAARHFGPQPTPEAGEARSVIVDVEGDHVEPALPAREAGVRS